MATPTTLEDRFLENLRRLGIGAGPGRLLVAVSGGRDSVALLHLLRFDARGLPLELTVAHLDHAMRPGSARDALWVRGLCRAWELPLVSARLPRAPAGETEAREARYAFLREAAAGAAATYVVTAHHADDQAETVLFRALRGTGIAGLAGMPAISPSGVLRPLLPFWRDEIAEFARERRLAWREDASNAEAVGARNVIRLALLPRIEREVAPAARRSLVALGEMAREAEAALEREVRRATAEVVREEGGWAFLARARLRDYDSTTGTRILRNLLRRFGVVPGRTGTRRALQFITRASSGRVMQLADGVRIEVEFGEARVGRPGPAVEDEPLEIGTLARGERVRGEARIGGRRYLATLRVDRWDGDPAERAAGWHAVVPLDSSLRFPLLLRGRRAGDRVWTTGGRKSLKKLLAECRVPRSVRPQLPVLADSAGAVLWVGGIERATGPLPPTGDDALFLTIVND